jgi:hypothetical protein
MFFRERLKLSEDFKAWAEKQHVKQDALGVITFLSVRGLLKDHSEDKSTKLVSAWANVMGDFNIKAVDGKIDIDDARKIISHYIGGVLDEINGEGEK